ncbi:MAG: IclR family transcriptional regulator [Rhodobacteraceae bacterium]|nr:IclR family transcriptional regulator [Paracoccaceae bacterium]
MAKNGSSDEHGTIPTNLRLLLVLEEMASAGVPVTPTDINQILGLPKPTIHRLFATLEAEGFIQREIDGRGYSPGKRMRNLSAGILSSLRIRTARVAILTRLAEQIGETCNVALPERDGMIYIDRIETKWPLRIQLPIGTRVPFYCTASGKLYLSSLSDQHLERYTHAANFKQFTSNTLCSPAKLIEEIQLVRKNGYAKDNEEFMDGMIALGVPITECNGRLVSTLSFHAPVQRLTMSGALKHLDALEHASASLSALISD